MIQAQLGEALGCEPPSITLMTRKLDAAGHIRRQPAPSDKRASIVELTDSGEALVVQVKLLWRTLAEETVTGLPAQTVAELPRVLQAHDRQRRHQAPPPRTRPPGRVSGEHETEVLPGRALMPTGCRGDQRLPAPWRTIGRNVTCDVVVGHCSFPVSPAGRSDNAGARRSGCRGSRAAPVGCVAAALR